MTNQEQKYQEFRAMGYDHIQAREMAMKHFEVVSRCPECQAEKSEYDFASHMELCSKKIPMKETEMWKKIMEQNHRDELRTFSRSTNVVLRCPACGIVYSVGMQVHYREGLEGVPLCTNEACGAYVSSGRDGKHLQVALLPEK